MDASSLPARVRLAALPTPLHLLPRLSAALGPRIWIKRDDLTGLAGGGNKTRKLEFVLADALARGARTLVTLGAPQSNHCRQTAAAAARHGLRCILVLRGHPVAGDPGNLLLDRLLGAELRWSGDCTREDLMDGVVREQTELGQEPYAIPLGASTPLGAAAYVLAMRELQAQASDVSFDHIVFASSSGGTHAGIAVGARETGFRGQVLGISIDEPLDTLRDMVAEIATGTAELLKLPYTFGRAGIHANACYLGAGYGMLGAPEREAIHLFATMEGVLLDPVYTARAAAALIDLVRKGEIGRSDSVLFWHTGGVPVLWAYSRELLAEMPH